MNIEISPRRVFITLLIIISFLLFANIMGIIAKYFFHLNDLKIVSSLIGKFDFDTEYNVPTLYSSLILAVNSLLFLIITIKHKQTGSDYAAWLGLMLAFLFLSLDEGFKIHEGIFSPIVREALHPSGLLYYAWVIPYGVAVAIFGVIYLPFLLRLPKKTKILFVVSGTIFVLGAIGFEMLGALQDEKYGEENLPYAILYTFEELLEMLGTALLVYTLLSYISEQFDHLTITIKEKIL